MTTGDREEAALKNYAEVTHDNPLRVLVDKARFPELLSDIGIERGSQTSHILRSVTLPQEFELEGSPSFSEFASTRNVGEEHIDGLLYAGAFSKHDIMSLMTIERSDWYINPDKAEETFAEEAPDLSRFLGQGLLRNPAWLREALRKIQQGNTTPIQFGYRAPGETYDLYAGTKALYWIDEVYGGDISVSETNVGREAIDGVLTLRLREKPIALFYWNNWYSNAIRQIVSPFMRNEMLGESQDRVIFTPL